MMTEVALQLFLPCSCDDSGQPACLRVAPVVAKVGSSAQAGQLFDADRDTSLSLCHALLFPSLSPSLSFLDTYSEQRTA